MSIKQRDRNRAELIKAIIRQNGGRIFTVIAKRKVPKITYRVYTGDTYEDMKPAAFRKLQKQPHCDDLDYETLEENFMEMTCCTGVKSQLAGGKSTIAHKDDLISVNLTNGKGYRCFSAYNVLEIRAGGAQLKFKEQHVLEFEDEANV